MLRDIAIEEITRVISVSTAPAFLLGAIVGMLSLLVGRLARITDAMDAGGGGKAAALLRRRIRHARTAIVLCVLSGLATGMMVDLVFVDTLLGWQNNRTIVVMFIAAIVLFTAALVFFLIEVVLSVSAFERNTV